MSIESLRAEIYALSTPLSAAWNAAVAAKADQDPTHALYKAWKKLDSRDSQLRARLQDLLDEDE